MGLLVSTADLVEHTPLSHIVQKSNPGHRVLAESGPNWRLWSDPLSSLFGRRVSWFKSCLCLLFTEHLFEPQSTCL